MSIFKDKTLKSVAEAAAKIMAETSHGSEPKTEKEKSLAALAHPKDKITHKDVLVGRGVLKKEETEQIVEVASAKTLQQRYTNVEKKYGDESKKDYDSVKGRSLMKKIARTAYNKHGVLMQNSPKNESVELEEELTAWQKVQRKKDELEDKRRERMEREDMPAPEKKKPTLQKVAGHRYGGSKQKDETNEETLPFTGMLESYTERGLKALSGIIREEPDNEQWTKELKDQEATAAGKKKPASVSAPATQGVKAMKEEDELTLDDFTPEEIEEFMQSEEYEQLDELSKSTLGSYIRKAASSARNRAFTSGRIGGGTGPRPDPESVKQLKISDKRVEGIRRASRKMEEEIELDEGENEQMKGKDPCWKGYEMVGTKKKGGREVPNCVPTKEEVELDERELSKSEMETKEKYVKGMKKGIQGFKQRYGERAKEVMYATATSMAKGD